MGAAASSPPSPDSPDTPPPCISCEQQKLKAESISTTKNQLTHTDCLGLYKAVEECMSTKQGQINLCQKEWTAFRLCHSNNK